jgi:hypothetical protein
MFGPCTGQRPEGLLSIDTDGGHLPLGDGQGLRKAVERTGDLSKGAVGGIKMRWDFDHPRPEQVTLAADPGARVHATQAGGGLSGDAGEPAVASARLPDRSGIALDHEDVGRECVGRHRVYLPVYWIPNARRPAIRDSLAGSSAAWKVTSLWRSGQLRRGTPR